MKELREVSSAGVNILIDLDLPYKVDEINRRQFAHNKLISSYLIRHAVVTKWRESMPRTDSRIWALIQDELTAEPGKLDLPRTHFDWLFEVINNCDYPGAMSSWRWTLLNYLEELCRKL
jgi:hypothetical protein